MDFDVYCDESRPDLFTSQNPQGQFMVIGSLWLPTASRSALKEALRGVRDAGGVRGEMKWTRVCPSKLDGYKGVVDWFATQGNQVRFRAIVIDRSQVDMSLHEEDAELGFYKFYYQMIHHWILDFNTYHIFCDFKTNKNSRRLTDLKRCLERSNLSSSITQVQAIQADESLFTQLCDVLTGMVSAKLNQNLRAGGAKAALTAHLEARLGRPIAKTPRHEHKFNIFQIDLSGGW